jgi:hypothetical protein
MKIILCEIPVEGKYIRDQRWDIVSRIFHILEAKTRDRLENDSIDLTPEIRKVALETGFIIRKESKTEVIKMPWTYLTMKCPTGCKQVKFIVYTDKTVDILGVL